MITWDHGMTWVEIQAEQAAKARREATGYQHRRQSSLLVAMARHRSRRERQADLMVGIMAVGGMTIAAILVLACIAFILAGCAERPSRSQQAIDGMRPVIFGPGSGITGP